MKKSKPKILFYDIETTLLMGYFFSLGKTVLRHPQLAKGYFSRTHVICITYKWDHEKKAKILTWGNCEEDEKKMIQDFDKLVAEADVIIGKNSNRFDNKHISTQRLWYGLDGMPEWLSATDDLERLMRKYFYLPSYALDYFSEQLGFGGKNNMSLSYWTSINQYRLIQCLGSMEDAALFMLFGKVKKEIVREGKAALKKMYVYGIKDTEDTASLWNTCVSHFEPKFNMATYKDDHCCKQLACGSKDIKKNGTRVAGQRTYQHFYCNTHGGYAGKAIMKKNGTFGKIH